jgi:hypothetical protein
MGAAAQRIAVATITLRRPFGAILPGGQTTRGF